MGFFDDVGKSLSNAFSNPLRGLAAIGTLGGSELLGAGVRAATGAQDGANGSGLPQVPAMDPRISQMADQQYQASQDYSNNAGNLKQQQGNLAQQSSNQALSDQQSKINQNSNSRGLLYSGLRQGAQAGARSQAAQGMASQQAGINQGIDQQAAQMRNQALSSQMGVQSLQNQRSAMAQNMAMADKNSKGLLGGLFG